MKKYLDEYLERPYQSHEAEGEQRDIPCALTMLFRLAMALLRLRKSHRRAIPSYAPVKTWDALEVNVVVGVELSLGFSGSRSGAAPG